MPFVLRFPVNLMEVNTTLKRYFVVLTVLLSAACLWSAQTSSSQKNTATPAASPTPTAAAAADIPGSTVVLTIHNVCEPKATPCETKLTKDQFDLILKTVGVKTPSPAERTSWAEKYIRLLAMAQGGIDHNLDQTDEGKLQMHLARLQALAQLNQKRVSEESSQVSDDDIKKYYDEHVTDYDELMVRHVIIPHVNLAEASGTPAPGATPTATVDPQKRKQEEDAATAALAEKARKRLVAGEDPDKVEKDVYAEANSKGTPPSTAASPRHHGNFPSTEEKDIFELKPGEVSKVLNTGYASEVYKIESKSTQPLDKVREEIKHKLINKRMTDSMQQMMVSADPDYNKDYFAAPPPPNANNNTPTAPVNAAHTRPTPAAHATH